MELAAVGLALRVGMVLFIFHDTTSASVPRDAEGVWEECLLVMSDTPCVLHV